MPPLFSDNFDGESEGTSPPANWINENMANCEVDDAQARSSPHSMRMVAPGTTGKCRHEESSGFTTDKITIWAYFPNATDYYIVAPQSTTGTFDTTKTTFHLIFDADGKIYYNDGANNDTGYTYSSGWHKIEVVHDFIAETEDVWYDDTKIVNSGAFRNSCSSCKAIHSYLNAADAWWWDDIQIGEGWTGKCLGVTNPTKVNGSLSATAVLKVNGVVSA